MMPHVSHCLQRYRGPLTPDRYNTFFYPNFCHVCKKEDNGNLIICDQCRMISYCSMEHKELHHLDHVQLCAAIKEYLEANPQTRCLDNQRWLDSKKDFLRSLEQQLSRQLLPYEEQMIKFAKSCLICYQQDNLRACQKCYSANYCLHHAKEFTKVHSSKCKKLMICVNLDIGYLNCYSINLNIYQLRNEIYCDMATFINTCVRRRICNDKTEWLFEDYIYSDFASGPLTVYSELWNAGLIRNDIRMEEKFVVHIISWTNSDKKYLPAWELFLHLSHHIKELIIILIGPDLKNDRDIIETCLKCRINEQRLYFETHCMLYHNYVRSQLYKKPSIIVGFQIELDDKYFGKEFIIAVTNGDCPFLLTAPTLGILGWNRKQIYLLQCAAAVPLRRLGINCSRSYRPYRHFETSYVFYRNKYVLFYTNLNSQCYNWAQSLTEF